jgi:hypothetical protein
MPYPYYVKRYPEVSLDVIVLDCPLLERCAAGAKADGARAAKACWDGGQQSVFLRDALARAAAEGVAWKVVACHYPLYANGPHANHKWLIDLVEPLMDEHHANLYINADNHYLQVSRKDGVAYVNSGGGGGYVAHSAADKGYARSPFSTFEKFGDGVVVHCIAPVAAAAKDGADAGAARGNGSDDDDAIATEMRSYVYGVDGALLHEFTLPQPRPVAGAVARWQGYAAGRDAAYGDGDGGDAALWFVLSFAAVFAAVRWYRRGAVGGARGARSFHAAQRV